MASNVPDDILVRLGEIEQKLEKWTSIDRIGSSDGNPLSIVKVGEISLFWTTTGPVADGESQVVYLTNNAKAGGESVFQNRPVVQAGYGSGSGSRYDVYARAAGPLTEAGKFKWQDKADVHMEADWLPSNKCYAVTVTNETGLTRDFAVVAMGV